MRTGRPGPCQDDPSRPRINPRVVRRHPVSPRRVLCQKNIQTPRLRRVQVLHKACIRGAGIDRDIQRRPRAASEPHEQHQYDQQHILAHLRLLRISTFRTTGAREKTGRAGCGAGFRTTGTGRVATALATSSSALTTLTAAAAGTEGVPAGSEWNCWFRVITTSFPKIVP